MHAAKLLHKALDAAGEGNWDWDIEAGVLVVSKGLLQMLGYPADHVFTPEAWLQLIHPDDFVHAQVNCHLHLEGKKASYVSEYRKKCYDGSYLWVLDRGVVVRRDAQGKPLHFIGFQRNISERKKNELLLRETNETAEIGGWEYNLKTQLLYWSELTHELHEVEAGFTPDVETAINFYKEGKSRDTIRERVKACIEKGEAFDEEVELITAKGKTIWVQSKGKAEFENDVCIRIYGAFRDITRQKQLQLQLELATQEFRSLFDHNPDGVAAFDPQGNIVAVNQQMLAVGAFDSPEQVIGINFSQFIPPHLQQEAMGHHMRTMQGQRHTYEIDVVTHKGNLRRASIVNIPIVVNAQVIGTYAIIRDITEQQELLRSLAKSEERFQLAVLGARDGIWDLDYRTGTRYKSARLAEMLGYPMEQLMDEAFFQSLPHPDDLAARAKSLEDHLSGKEPYYNTEFRMLCADGTYRWFLSRGKALFDEAGNPIRISGSLTDIHEQKLTQDALVESKDRLQAAIMGTRDGIFDWNIATGHAYFSDRFCELLQYNCNQLGKGFDVITGLIHSEDKEGALQTMDAHFQKQNSFYDAEFRMLTGGGAYRWFRIRGQASWDESGVLVRFSGSLTDVHQRKQLQSDLKEANLLLQQSKLQLSEMVTLQNAIIDAIPDKIFRLQQNGIIRFCQVPKNSRLFPINLPAQGDNLVEQLLPYWDLQRAMDTTLQKGGLTIHEFHIDRPEGRFYFEARLLPMEESELFLIIRNITEQKIAEEERLRNELKYTRLIENMNIGLLEVDRDEMITRAHPRFCEMVGYTEAEILGKNARELFLPDGNEALKMEETNRRRLEGHADIYEARIKTKSGKVVDLLISGTPLTNDKGEVIGSVGIHYDISEKKRAERLLEESNTIGKIGTFEIDLVDNKITWSHVMYDIFETAPGFQPALDNVFPLYPEGPSRDRVKALFELIVTDGTPCDEVLEIVTPAGKRKWIRTVAAPDRSAGSTVRIVGVAMDVTQTVTYEQQLRNYTQLSDTIITSIRDGFYVVDADWNLVFINEAAGSYIHKNWSELIGTNIWEILPHEKDAFLPHFQEVRDTRTAKVVMQQHSVGDHTFWLEISFYPTSAGGVSVLFKDVSTTRQQEVEIRKLNERYAAISKATSQIIFDWNFFTDQMSFNEVFYRITGYPNTPMVNTGAFGYSKVHPDDLLLMQTTMQKAFALQKPLIVMTYRFRNAADEYLTLRSRGLVRYNDAGQPVEMIGACEDISDTIRLNESLIQERVNVQRKIHEATIHVQETEREEIGRELHDNVNQILTTASLYLQLVEGENHPGSATIQAARNYISNAIQEIRVISRQLAPPSLKDIGLAVALSDLVTMIDRASSTTFTLSMPDESMPELDNERGLILYRICQELLNNVIKYAVAENCHIALERIAGKKVILRVKDDGKGFDQKKTRKGLGLSNTVTRVEVYGGAFRISSAPGKGCAVEVELPLK